MADSQLATNPFFVLDLRPTASRPDVERAGGKLLSMLEVGIGRAGQYDTPVGAQVRTPEAVRLAMAELREPERRLRHELWAAIPAGMVEASAGAASGADDGGWPEVWALTGWKGRR